MRNAARPDEDRAQCSRRRFIQGVGATAAWAAAWPRPAWAGDGELKRHPLDSKYLAIGLTGMGRAGYEDWAWAHTPPGGGKEDRTGVMNAHWGAAVIAAYYMLKEIPFDEAVAAHMKKVLDLLIKKKAQYFEPFEEEAPQEKLIEEVPKSIEASAHTWRAHGHRKIFVVHAVRALRERPDMAQPRLIKGLVKIAETTDRVQRAARISARLREPYRDEQALIDWTFESLYRYRDLRLGPVGTRPRNGVFPKGNFVHWLTHTDALVGLRGLGFENLAKRGHGPLKFHIARERRPPDDIARNNVPEKRLGVEHLLSMDYWGRREAEDPG